MSSRDVALDAAGDNGYDAHSQRGQLDAECVRVGMQSGLCGGIYRGEDVGHDACEAPCLNNGAFCFNQHGCEDLTKLHDGEDVSIEGFLDLAHVDVGGGDGVITTGVVIEDVEAAAGHIGDAVAQMRYRGMMRELERQVRDVVAWGCVFGRVADGGQNVEAWTGP